MIDIASAQMFKTFWEKWNNTGDTAHLQNSSCHLEERKLSIQQSLSMQNWEHTINGVLICRSSFQEFNEKWHSCIDEAILLYSFESKDWQSQYALDSFLWQHFGIIVSYATRRFQSSIRLSKSLAHCTSCQFQWDHSFDRRSCMSRGHTAQYCWYYLVMVAWQNGVLVQVRCCLLASQWCSPIWCKCLFGAMFAWMLFSFRSASYFLIKRASIFGLH